MIYSAIIGGLGNQMFQYAVGRACSEREKTILKLDTTGFETYPHHSYSLQHFNIIENYASRKEVRRFHWLRDAISTQPPHFLYRILRKMKIAKQALNALGYVRESQRTYDSSVVKLSGTRYLDGYWHTEKYFKDIETILRKEFSLKQPMGKVGQEFAANIHSQNTPICLHVRRGDFANNPEVSAHHGVTPLSYYYDAVKVLARKVENPHFFIFSDSLDWAKENISLPYPMSFVGQGADKNHEDIILMSYCKHHILSNSTFGWWGAWLANSPDQVVIAPKKWLAKEIDISDRLPESWIQM